MALPPLIEPTSTKKKWISVAVKLIFAIVASTAITSLKLDSLESFFYDTRVKVKSKIHPKKIDNNKSILIMIDYETVVKFKGFPKYSDHVLFLNKLKSLNPKFILYDFRTKDGELLDIEGDFSEKILFAEAVSKTSHFYILTDDLELKGEVGKLNLNPPLEFVNRESAPKTSDSILFARDGVSRRFMVSYQDNVLLHPRIAGWYNHEVQDLNNIRGLFDLYDSKQGYTQFHKPNSFLTIKFEDVINDNVSAEAFKDKIIIVGTDTGKSSKEYVATPFSNEVTSMRSTEYHANILQTLIENNAPVRWPRWSIMLITYIISLITVYAVFSLRPSRGLLILLLTSIGLCLVILLSFIYLNIWIDLAHPLLAIFICYYFFIPYRLIKENRLTWEYYQRNKLLKQVEELKTNFISMMSHDLKTPIARIQGMTELIHKDETKLSLAQNEALDHIKSSSDDLLKFINSILQYGQIESQGLQLNLKSKDVNLLLEETIHKHEFLAKIKKIKIITQLETLFPIMIDADLMKQVFSNLIENAIKYSHENSTVYVSSREENNSIYIDFKDQGVGIPSVDLPNIFMKFFRSHNAKISTIKGSGLGLYLAQYFVELHKGQISVTSEVGHGSCFTVNLPIN